MLGAGVQIGLLNRRPNVLLAVLLLTENEVYLAFSGKTATSMSDVGAGKVAGHPRRNTVSSSRSRAI